jgi:hypothetical protein
MTGNFDIMSDEVFDWEIAQDILHTMCIIRREMILGETGKPRPDESLIGQWKADLERFSQKRLGLRIASHEDVLRVIEEYCPQASAWYEEGAESRSEAAVKAEGQSPDPLEEAYQKYEAISLLGSEASALPQPVAIIWGGVDGKSMIREQMQEELADLGGILVIDIDEARKFHPSFKALMREDDKAASSTATQEVALNFTQRLLRERIDDRRNLFLDDQTSGNIEKVLEQIEQLRGKYHISFQTMSVNKAFSVQSVFMRYEKQKIKSPGGFGSFMPLEIHDGIFEGVSDTLKILESQVLVDSIFIYDWNGKVLYSNERKRTP